MAAKVERFGVDAPAGLAQAPVRIGVAFISQESNTFNPHPATMVGFESFGVYRGERMLGELAGVGAVGGFLSAIEAWDGPVEVVPLLKARDVAGGRLAAATLDALAGELTALLAGAGPLDVLVMLLHGACAAEGEDDADGHLLAAARTVAGPRLPIVVGLDHHANITERMVDLSTAIIGHRTQPHDPSDTGRRAGELALRVATGAVAPTVAARTLRLLSHQEQFLTGQGPMKTWFDAARAIEQEDGVLAVSPFPMQPWLDLAEGGWSVVVVTDGDRELAARHADEMADLAWSMRAQFQETTSVSPEQAVALASRSSGLVILSDTGDSVFGGAGGDSTVLLAELLRVGAPTALVPLIDPEAARTLARAGVGERVELAVGGGLTQWFAPVEVVAEVVTVADPVLRDLPGYTEAEVRMGTTVVAVVANVTLVISERPGVAGNHPGMYEHLGLRPAEYGVVVLKTASNFQWYEHLTMSVIRVDTAGPTQSSITELPWRRVPRPIYPIDRDLADWR
ncbi:M81 family metallopeptidase [Georgenia sp. MJ173]|uniref:M81 family metallopeptidase n=1 Tax=Georgenia sunbinii TaxID=3117728 RepID=UPI002F26949A